MRASVFYSKALISFIFALCLSGCQTGYIVKSGYHQLGILLKKKKVERALQDPRLDTETKRKIQLVQEVKKFAEENLSIIKSKNYDSFVLLDDKYVTYVVTASRKNELKPYTWSFPIVGTVPYKGFFTKAGAEDEKNELLKQNLDVSIRGVSAYSTLGWFADPLLSTMTKHSDEILVETIIHELTHMTVFFKDQVDFNEQLATFVGEHGAIAFFEKKYGKETELITKTKNSAHDSRTFSEFLSRELKKLEEFYATQKNSPTVETDRLKIFADIKKNFELVCKPKLKTQNYLSFKDVELNNAYLLSYKTYYNRLDLFEEVFKKSGSQWKSFFEYLRSIASSNNPWQELEKKASH